MMGLSEVKLVFLSMGGKSLVLIPGLVPGLKKPPEGV